MVLPTADILGKEAAAHSRLLGRCVQGQPNNRSKLFGEHLFFFLVKDIGNLISLSWRPLFTLMTTSSTLPNIYDNNPQNSSWHSFTHPSTHWNLNSWEYIILRDVLIISCYDKEGGIKSCVGCKIYFCFLCHDNMTGLLSTLYIIKMTQALRVIINMGRYEHVKDINMTKLATGMARLSRLARYGHEEEAMGLYTDI